MRRLLLKCDGMRAEDWCPLDPEPPYRPPDTWDAPHVQHRFAEAIGTLLRLPLGRLRPAGFRTSWPSWFHDWDYLMSRCGNAEELAAEDLVSNEFIAAYRQWHADRVQLRPDPPSAQEIGAMERALEWPGRYLQGQSTEQARALNLVALSRAREVELKDVVPRGRHGGVNSTTVWQALALEAATRIATGLRADEIVVF